MIKDSMPYMIGRSSSAAWTIGNGPREYGLALANKPRKKHKYWRQSNKRK